MASSIDDVAGADLVGDVVVDGRGVEPADRPAAAGPRPRPGPAVSSTTSSTPQSAVTRGQAALGRDEQHRDVDAGGAQQPAQLRTCGRSRRPSTRIASHRGASSSAVASAGSDPHLVEQQPERGQHLGRGLQGVGQQQQRGPSSASRLSRRSRARDHRPERERDPGASSPGSPGGRIANVDLRPSSGTLGGPSREQRHAARPPTASASPRRRPPGRGRRPPGLAVVWRTASPAVAAARTTGGSPTRWRDTAGSSPTTAAGTARRPGVTRSATTRCSTSTPPSAGPAGSASPDVATVGFSMGGSVVLRQAALARRTRRRCRPWCR